MPSLSHSFTPLANEVGGRPAPHGAESEAPQGKVSSHRTDFPGLMGIFFLCPEGTDD